MRQISLLIAALTAAIAIASSAFCAEERIDYLQHIKPLLVKRCYACHGALKQEAGLRLDTAALALKGGNGGSVITPGNATASILIQRVTASDESERMPPIGESLKPGELAALRTWINQNAEAPIDEQPESDPRDHWAFRPIVRPPVPQVANPRWVRNPIDAFIAQQHEQFGLTPQSEASHDVLKRRLSFDLVGLPPTQEDSAQRNTSAATEWYERFVQQLLDDPRHGERWARHWMDIWRYSDWWGLGDQLRNSQHHIWHWRDWIVESLNANTPYDEMVRLMLAGDELHPNDLNKLRATGFLARNYFLFNRNHWMDETVEHVSKGFLGLTMNCAKCHDHKFDPITQVDFYRMRAFFEPYHVRLDMVFGEPDLARDGIPRVFDGQLGEPTYVFERGQETLPDKSIVIAPGVPELLACEDFEIHPVSLPKEAWQPERRPWVPEAYMSAAKKNVVSADATYAAAKETHEKAKNSRRETDASAGSEPSSSREQEEAGVADAAAELRLAECAVKAARAELVSVESRVAAMCASWTKADGDSGNAILAEAERTTSAEAIQAERGAAVAKALQVVADVELKLHRSTTDKKETLEKELNAARDSLAKAEQNAAATIAPADQYTKLVGAKWTPTRFLSSTSDDPLVEFPAMGTGRRTALASWITDRRNPLTARVAVNHIWMRHMGTPLVATVFDFGRKGNPPSHPELLDWLAAELIDSGWDMKHIHRLIVQSSTYRMSSSSAGSDANLAKDPDNTHFWRRTPIRLESEVVRDSILSLAGTLDLSRGGPPVLPAAQADSTRRSLYFFHSNNDRNLLLATFDEAAVKECYRRDQSIVPQQALALSNSRLVHDAAKQIAERLSRPAESDTPPPDDHEFVQKAFYELLGNSANEDEVRASIKALGSWRMLTEVSADTSTDLAREYLVWALLNHNDFITVR